MRASSRAVEHVGEWRVAIAADSLEEVFAEVTRVVARTGGTPRGHGSAWEAVALAAPDVATLLADWANELIGRSEVADRSYDAVRNVRIRRSADGAAELSAEVLGRPLEAWGSPLKAATYHALSLEQRGARWHAMLLFDV